MKPSFKDFDPRKFKNAITKINWRNKLQIEKNNSHLSLRFFLKTIEELLNRKCLIEKVSQKISYEQKPWITGLVNSINKNNNINEQFCKSQNITKTIALQKKLQTLQNSLCYNIPFIQRKIFLKKFLEKIKKTQKRYGKLLMQSLIITKTQKNHDKSAHI